MQILFEDDHIIALNKRPGEPVQPDKSGDQALTDQLRTYILERFPKTKDAFTGVVHRIDRPVGGVVLFARNPKVLALLNDQLQKREFRKIYWAITEQAPKEKEGELRHWLVQNGKTNKSIAYDLIEQVPEDYKKEAKEAILRYRLLASSERYHLLEVELITGRHHQIRCQLSKIGCPVKGDLKYGAARSNRGGGISLWARELTFKHPIEKRKITVTAPTPPEDNLWAYFENAVSVSGSL